MRRLEKGIGNMKYILGLLGISVIGFFAWVWWHGRLPDFALFSFTGTF